MRGTLLILGLALAGGCGSSAEETRATRVTFVRATPKFGTVPFPSDLFRHDGRVDRIEGFDRVVGAHADALQEGYAALDGFGRTTATLFFVDGPVEPSAVAAMLVDVDATSPDRGKKYPVVTKVLPSMKVISVLPLPGTVLDPGRKYAVALAKNATLVGDDGWLATAKKTKETRNSPADKLYGDALDVLVETGATKRDDVAGLAVFTTSRAVEELPVLREIVRASTPRAHTDVVIKFTGATTPSLDDWLGAPIKDDAGHDWPGLDNPGGVPHDAIGAVATFSYESPSFLNPRTHHFEGRRVADPHARVPVTVVVPSAPPPATGYPVIVAAHGLGGTRNNLLAIANELARAGFVTIGIDDVAHGARRGTKDLINNYAGTYKGPDGLPDRDQLGGLDFFAGFIDMLAIRDNFRQTVLDHVALVRLVQEPGALDGVLGAKLPLDGQRVVWTGGSFGGIMGATTVAVEPELRAASLQVPGGGFVHLLIPGSLAMSGLVHTVVRGAYRLEDEEALDQFHPLSNLAATIVEAGDPLVFAPHVFKSPLMKRERPAQVLLTYALDDEVLPNLATHALIRAMGLPVLGSPLSPIEGVPLVAAPATKNLFGGTGVAVEYAPATHALGYQRWGDRSYLRGADGVLAPMAKPVRIEMPLREHLAQVVHFFNTSEAIQTAKGRPFDPTRP